MGSAQFTRKYADRSDSNGFQFEFYCDCCGAAYKSSYRMNKLGLASSILNAASNLLGGQLSRVASVGGQLNQAMRGKVYDDAFESAIAEIKPLLRQCNKCNQWICSKACWDEKSGSCGNCRKSLDTELNCAQCGKPVPTGAKFCSNCGAPRK